MDAFAAAIDDLFADPNLTRDALWRPGGAGPGIPVRVIVRQPDRIGEFGDTRVSLETLTFGVRASEVPSPAEDDTIELDGKTFVVQGEALSDAARLVWTIDTRPA